jgi:hypothetical protein
MMQPGRRVGAVHAGDLAGRRLADGQHQVAAGRHGRSERRGGTARRGRVQEVQDGRQQDAHRLGQVDEAGQDRIGEDGRRVPQVARHRDDPGAAGPEGAGVRDDHRIVVDVDDPGVGHRGFGRLVRAGAGRQACAHVDELADPLSRRVGDGAGQEGAVVPGQVRQPWVRGQQPGRLVAVGGEVGRAPEQVVVNARDVRLGGVRCRDRLLQPRPQPVQAAGGDHAGVGVLPQGLGHVGEPAPDGLAPDHEAREIGLERFDVGEHAQIPVQHGNRLPATAGRTAVARIVPDVMVDSPIAYTRCDGFHSI